jgi:predicted HAD superfamily Cof-like phosphohydrolase
MAKLFPDGKPRYRESDGKIIKPDGWVAPEPKLKSEIERQKEQK